MNNSKGNAMIKRTLVFSLVILLFCGCAYKSYDPENPEEYDRYWKQEKNRKGSILYPLTDEAREEYLKKKYGDAWRDYK